LNFWSGLNQLRQQRRIAFVDDTVPHFRRADRIALVAPQTDVSQIQESGYGPSAQRCNCPVHNSTSDSMNLLSPHRLRSTLDQLETRDVPSAWLSSSWTTPTAALVAPVVQMRTSDIVDNSSIGDQVAAYAAAHLGERIGGGECAHLAVEALRTSGARFAWLTGPTANYAWGQLLTRVTGTTHGAVFSKPAVVCRPGDIIQFVSTRFSDGMWANHHTAIVAAVDGAGRPTAVYQQNFNGVRVITEESLDLSRLTSGFVKIYRALPRTQITGRYQFTMVNNTGASLRAVERAGSSAAAYRLSPANSLGSYQVRRWSTYGGARPTIVVGSSSIAVRDGAAYEIYDGWDGPMVREL
jgi:hypothetical protein